MTSTNTEAVSDLPSEAEVFRTMHVLLEGIAQIAENHGFERGDDLMVWLSKNLSRRAANSAGGVEVLRVIDAHFDIFDKGRGERNANVAYAIKNLRDGVVAALSSPAVEAEPVAWQHKLTGVIRTDKPAVSMGLHEDYDPLYTHPSSPVSAEVTVTDEMVERAVASSRSWATPITRAGIRRILAAALNGKE
jgi:hypothetical protein